MIARRERILFYSRADTERSLTTFEFLILVLVMLIFVGVFAIFGGMSIRSSRERVLRNEINNIRMSIEYYRILNGRLPESLLGLLNQNVAVNNIKDSKQAFLRKENLKPFRLDKDGYLLDPFFNQYYYNKESGIIKSTTKGYESW